MKKNARKGQPNGTHTTGSRSFAVVQEQTEIQEGKQIGRAELYRITHTNSKGLPVDDFAARKIDETNKNLSANPALLGEEPNPNDLYSTLFPKAKKSTRHGLGMVVGGKGSENLAQALAALEESRKESRDLKLMVENMARKTDIIEGQLIQLMLVYQASQKVQDNQQQQTSEQGMEGLPTIQVTKPNVEKDTSSEVLGSKANETRSSEETHVNRSQKPNHNSEVAGSQAKATTTHEDRRASKNKQRKSGKEPNGSVPKVPPKSMRTQPRQEAIYTQDAVYSQEAVFSQEAVYSQETMYSQEGMFSHQVEGNQSKTTYKHLEAKVRNYSCNSSVNKIIKSVKLEKAQENKMKSNEVKKRKNKGIVKVTKGMDVALTSPTSELVVALGTVQNADTEDYIEVMINMVLKRTTKLPQAKGRMTLLGHAEAHSVQWPRQNVSTEDVDLTHAKIMSSMDKNLRIHSRSDVDYWADLEIVNDDKNVIDDDKEPTQLEKEPAPAARWSPEDKELYCLVDTNDPESVRKGWELQSKQYAVHALRHYNAGHCNGGVKYKLVEATGSQGIVLDSGHMIGHVTFTARATTGHDPTVPQQADPRPFFAEVHEPDLVPTCMVSMDDGEE
ncbi:hypothetical protein ACQ4PT_062328 [Festuca glaucescens]